MAVIDAAALHRLRNELGDDVVVDLVRTFLDDASELTSTMQDASARGDLEALKRAAHALKSTAVLMGAEELMRSCRELELIDGAAPPRVVERKVGGTVGDWLRTRAELQQQLRHLESA